MWHFLHTHTHLHTYTSHTHTNLFFWYTRTLFHAHTNRETLHTVFIYAPHPHTHTHRQTLRTHARTFFTDTNTLSANTHTHICVITFVLFYSVCIFCLWVCEKCLLFCSRSIVFLCPISKSCLCVAVMFVYFACTLFLYVLFGIVFDLLYFRFLCGAWICVLYF